MKERVPTQGTFKLELNKARERGRRRGIWKQGHEEISMNFISVRSGTFLEVLGVELEWLGFGKGRSFGKV